MAPMLKHILIYLEALRTSGSFLWPCVIKLYILKDFAEFFFLARSDVLSSPALAFLEFCYNLGSEQRGWESVCRETKMLSLKTTALWHIHPRPQLWFHHFPQIHVFFLGRMVPVLIQTKCGAVSGTTWHGFLFCPETMKGWGRATLPTSTHWQ